MSNIDPTGKASLVFWLILAVSLFFITSLIIKAVKDHLACRRLEQSIVDSDINPYTGEPFRSFAARANEVAAMGEALVVQKRPAGAPSRKCD